MPRPPSTLSTHYRWAIASRTAAAALGGFLLTSAFAVLLTWLLVRGGAMARATIFEATSRREWHLQA